VEITGTGGRYVTRRGPLHDIGPDWNDEFGEGTAPYTASPTDGIDALISLNNDSQAIIHINPSTLAEHAVATIPRSDAEYQTTAALDQGNTTYFLDPHLNGTPDAPAARLLRLTNN
jgi:hypothetical protein